MEVGRPSKFKEEYIEQAYKLSLLGATDKAMASFFEVTESTLNLWKLKHPKFSESIKEGKAIADIEVAHSLYKTCIDRKVIEQQAHKVKVNQFKEKIEIVEVEKVIPADFRSISFWLRNRKSDAWKEKQELSVEDNSIKIVVNRE